MRRLIILTAAVLVVLLAGSFLAWRWAVGEMQAQLVQWESAQQAHGWTIRHAPPESGGWPLAATLALPEFAAIGPALPGGVAWRAGRVTLRVSLLQPALAVASVSGAQQVQMAGQKPLGFIADRFEVSVPISAKPEAAGLDARGVHIDGGATIGLLEGQITQQAEAGAVRLRMTAEAIDFPPPPAAQPPLGGHIASASGEAEITGPQPQPGMTPAQSAAAWQQAGGEIKLTRMAAGWGPLGLSGTGALSLDPQLQPALTAKLHLVGYEAALQAMAAAHVITPNAARAAAAVLSLLATVPDGGGPPAVDAPVTVAGRTLSMGRIPLLKLPEMDWSKLVWPSGAEPASVAP